MFLQLQAMLVKPVQHKGAGCGDPHWSHAPHGAGGTQGCGCPLHRAVGRGCVCTGVCSCEVRVSVLVCARGVQGVSECTGLGVQRAGCMDRGMGCNTERCMCWAGCIGLGVRYGV